MNKRRSGSEQGDCCWAVWTRELAALSIFEFPRRIRPSSRFYTVDSDNLDTVARTYLITWPFRFQT